MPALAFIALAWVAVIFYWIVSALSGIPRQGSRHFTSRFFSMFLVFLAFVLIAGALRFPPFSDYVYALSWPVETLGVLLVYVGLVFALYARLTGVTLYSVRYPIYIAPLIMFLGTALAVGRVDGYLALALMLLSFWMRTQPAKL